MSEVDRDLATIMALAESGQIESDIDNLLRHAWYYGWTTGFAFQGPAEEAMKEALATLEGEAPEVIEVDLPEERT